MPLSTLKVPLNIGLFLLLVFVRKMRFLRSKSAQKRSKMQITPALFNFRQLLFYDLPPKNASKYPKIAIFRFAIIVIFNIGLLQEPKNAPKPIFFPNQSLGVTTHV